MKFIVIGSPIGHIDLVNEYIEKSECDFVLCTGDMGLFYRTNNLKSLPRSFRGNNFYEYLEGKKKFIKPIISVRGSHDNLSLCRKLQDKIIQIDNFSLLKDGESVSIEDISIAGIGGSYSPKYYDVGPDYNKNVSRHFHIEHVNKLKKKKSNILLLHDLVGDCNKNKILYSSATYSIFDAVEPYYCFVGKYHWWGYTKLLNMNVVILPYAKNGYVVVDIENGWKAEGIRFDIDIGGR